MFSAFVSKRFRDAFVTAMVIAIPANSISAPVGDYGDAPDDGTRRFPTLFATTNSRLGQPGAHHTSTGEEMLGIAVSNEEDAIDPSDPDSVPNLIDADGFDDGLLGVSFTNLGNPFPASGVELYEMEVTLQITVAPTAPATTRSLNILVDANRDQEWRNTSDAQEWVAVNLPIYTAPGDSEVITIPLDVITSGGSTPAADMWMRVTLTRTPIDENMTTGVGGWDGSGAFEYGETEDYLIFSSSEPEVPIPPPPPDPGPGCECVFKVRARPKVVVVPHTAASPEAKFEIIIQGPAACRAEFEEFTIVQTGPMIGVGVSNGVDIDDVGPTVPAPGAILGIGAGKYTITVPFDVHEDGPCRIQSFSVRVKIGGFCGGTRVYAANKTAGILVIHDCADFRWGRLEFGPGPEFEINPLEPIPVPPVAGHTTPTVGVVFQELTSTGSLTVVQENGLQPRCVPPSTGTLDRQSFFELDFEYPPLLPPSSEPIIQTEIIQMTLGGWTPLELTNKGIANENLLRLGRMPIEPDGFFPTFFEIESQVGVNQVVDTTNHLIHVQGPFGFSSWTIGEIGSPGVPVSLSQFEVE